MGRPLGSKNKPRSESQDSQRPRKRVVPILVRNNKEDEYIPDYSNDLNEIDRFTYIPSTREVRPPITLLPSNAAPQSRRYTILDRIEDENEIPIYILREDVASNLLPKTSLDSPRSQRTASVTSDLKLTPLHNGFGSVRTRSTASPHNPQPIPHYDPNDPSFLRISLLHIDKYVSPRQVEEYENKRFANPKPEDDPFANRRGDTSSQSSGSSGRRLVVYQEEVREKRPVGRPPKKRRLMEAVVINNAVSRSPLSRSSMSGSEQSDGQSIGGIQSRRGEDREGDVDMMDSIEQDGLDSIPESEVEETLRAFFPNRITETSPRRSPRSISTVESPSSMAPPKSPKQVAGSPQGSRNTRSRATSCASARSSLHASRSPTVVSSVHAAAPPPTLLPPAPITKSSRLQKSSHTTQRPRPEVATADLAKELIAQQFGLHPKSRLQPASPKRVSKPSQPSVQPDSSLATSSKQKRSFRPNFIQSKLSFPKAPARPKSPPPKPKSPAKKAPDPPPPAEDDEDEDEDGEPEYEVSKILSHHDNEFSRYYRVAWKGFPEEDSTYLTEEELDGAKKLLKRYKKEVRRAEKAVRKTERERE